jgi:hypothetical protein
MEDVEGDARECHSHPTNVKNLNDLQNHKFS